MNSYGVTHRLLRPARLPISPPPRNLTMRLYIIYGAKSSKLNTNILIRYNLSVCLFDLIDILCVIVYNCMRTII